jgi:hypothetical protein
MALVTNNISGSSAGDWKIGVTGSVIIANPGSRPWPTFPGTDVDLFVSGNAGGVTAGNGVTVFGGDVVLSGTLFGGSPLKIGTDVGVTGSLALNNVVSAPTAGANEAVLYARAGTLYFKNAGGGETAVGSGGGGGGGPFTEESNVAAYTTSSIAVGIQAAAATKGTNVFLFVSGASDGSKDALFGGNIVTSGSLQVTSTSGEIAHIAGNGEISGSGDLKAGGSLTVGGTAQVVGTSTLTGDVTFGGNILAVGDTAKSIFTAVTSNAITIGQGTSTLTARNLTVNGTTITATTPTSINLGDTAATVNVGQSGTSNILNVRGNANISGNAVISGDLTVNGTTTSVNTTNLLVKDPLVYLASASSGGTINYGGIAIASGSGLTDQSLVFVRESNGSEAIWSAGRQDVSGGLATTNLGLTYLPVRASKFEIGGTQAFLTSSFGHDATFRAGSLSIHATGSNALVISGSTGPNNGVQIRLSGITYGQIKADGNNIVFGSPANTAYLSGSGVALQHGIAGAVDFFNNTTGYFRINSGPSATQLFGNSDADISIAPFSGATGKNVFLSGSNISLSGSSGINFYRGTSRIAFVGASPTNSLLGLHPDQDVTYNLGAPERRWANIYTGDLHLRNDRGDWTIIEERDYLSITNNYNGKRYKFVLEEI